MTLWLLSLPPNPDTEYGIVDGFIENAPANVHFLGFAEQEGSFLVGAAAALACDCDHIGFIGGQEIDLIKRFEAGYAAGAKQINPDMVVESQYLGAAGDNAAWGSPDKAKEIALGWYADGVEVIYHRSRRFGPGHHRGGRRGRQVGHRRRLRPVPDGDPPISRHTSSRRCSSGSTRRCS